MTNILGGRTVIVDSDAHIGLIHKDDKLHRRCLEVSKFLAQNNFTVITPYPIVLEAATTLSRAKPVKRPDLSAKLLKDFASTEETTPIDTNVSELVAKLYDPKTSAKNTPFDHYVLALAIKNNVRVVFSFDSFYKKHGLILAEELLKN